jgi:hypothetical protein
MTRTRSLYLLALVLVILGGWWVATNVIGGDSGSIQRVEHTHDATDSAPATLSAAEDEPLAAAPRTAERSAPPERNFTATDSSGRFAFAFRDVLSPRRSVTGESLAEVQVACIRADGSVRHAALDEAVTARDLAAGGLWAVSDATSCPRFLDPALVVAACAQPDSLPLALELAASATLVVEIEAPPAGRQPVSRVELSGANHGQNPEACNRAVSIFNGPFYLAEEQFRLFREVLAAPDHTSRAALLARARAAQHFPLVAGITPDRPHAHAMPWVARVEAGDFGARLVFANVPAGAPVFVAAPTRDLVAFDGAEDFFLRSAQMMGRSASAPITLAPGEVRAIALRHQVGATILGAFPADAVAPERPGISCEVQAKGSSGTAGGDLGVYTLHENGSFAWTNLLPGEYTLSATWRDTNGRQGSVRLVFTLAEGEVHDIGVLGARAGLDLTLVPHFVAPGGAAEEPEALPAEVAARVAVCARVVARPSGENRPATALSVFFFAAEPLTLTGLEPGSYTITPQALVSAEKARKFGALRWGAHDPDTEAYISESDARAGAHDLRLASGSSPLTVELGANTSVDVTVPLVGTAPVALQVPVAPHLAIANLRVYAWYVRDAGRHVEEAPAFGWQGLPNEPGLATATNDLPSGDWTVFALLELPPTGHEQPRWHVAREDFTVVPGEPRTLSVVLGTAASLRTHGQRRGGDTPRLAEFPHWIREDGGYVEGVDELWSWHALVPNATYLVGADVPVTTGPPGSLVELR